MKTKQLSKKILVINAGSSSVKYAVFEILNEKKLKNQIKNKSKSKSKNKYEIKNKSNLNKVKLKEILRGNIKRIGLKNGIKNHSLAIKKIISIIKKEIDLNNLVGVGHRVVHGLEISQSCKINKKILNKIKEAKKYAPLHEPYNLKGIEEIQKQISQVSNVAVFDTSFHTTIPPYASKYAIPYKLGDKYKIKRYGFHGISHKYVFLEACKKLNLSTQKSRVITCHLGNGCSITAIKNGKSIDTTMGFTPLEGLIMGTRSGDIDPAIATFLQKNEHLSANQVYNLLNKKSGFLGISGISDFLDLKQKKKKISAKKNKSKQDKLVLLAYSMFVYHIQKYIGAYISVLGGVDAIVFTGGIGENNSSLVKECVLKLNYLRKKIKIIIVKTNEELEIAKELIRVLRI